MMNRDESSVATLTREEMFLRWTDDLCMGSGGAR
jgi:hypothetical protein